MSATSIVMMIIAIVVLWGGLTLAILNLSFRSPANPTEPRHGPQS
ncbi:methionine/alanine import family NSS transporter small subunit [Propionibacteriaceae bacterium Y2011]